METDMEDKLSHFDAEGNAIMVDISEKPVTNREAVAAGRIQMSRACFDAVREGSSKKGDVLGAARIAGIMGAKRTADLIPLCHVLGLNKASVDFAMKEESLEIEASCTIRTTGKTGVEMEALTGASVALLTIYDMCKAMDRAMVIKEIRLIRKTGGKSGN